MSVFSNVVVLVLLLFIQTSQLCFCKNPTSSCNERERQALLKFRESFTRTALGPLSSWEGNDCCKWKGVGCDAVTGHVIKLDASLSCFPESCMIQCALLPDCAVTSIKVGSISPSLLELEHLNYLDLSGYQYDERPLDSNPIPEFLGSMMQLRYLSLSSSGFTGRIPHQLGNLSNLHVLDISGNQGLYDDDMSWLSKLSSLTHLTLSSVSLEKATNLFKVIYMFPSLLQAEFSDCSITNIHIPRGPFNSTFLPNLELLDLSHNALDSPIPDAFQNMTAIRDLDLSYNSLHSVPHWLGNLHSLVHLNLSSNSISRIEGSIISVLRNTCSLQSLDLSPQYIEGSEVSSVTFGRGNLSGCTRYDLQELLLSGSRIRDSLPSWLGELKNLKTLHLRDNLFHGEIPASLGRLSGLVDLDFSNNQLNGTIPHSLGQLVNLSTLNFSKNSLEGTFSEIHLKNLSNINTLQIGFNKLSVKIDSNWTPPFQFLTDLDMASCNIGTEIPQWLQTQRQLENLDLSNSGIWGKIPTWILEIESMRLLDLSNNKMSGSIPKNFGDQLISLEYLNLKGNLLEGSIPNTLCKLHVYFLELSDNRLSSEIPDCWSKEELTMINLSSNKLSGTIPRSFGNLSGLFWLNLSNNSLHGELSQALKNINRSQILDLGGNLFTGVIPSWIGRWEKLKVLRLSQNLLSGDIPSSLCQFPSLRILDLASNSLSGSIPNCIGNLNGMIKQSRDDSITIEGISEDLQKKEGIKQVLKGLEQDYTHNLRYLRNIDLSNNHMIGFIPESFTNLSGLIGLNLSHNKLLGNIPSKIGEMKSLESIDLSSNQLYGAIPTNMPTLTSLGFLNLSNNNFSGLIPKGAQFSTFDPSSYGGNAFLCGAPLSNACPGDHEITQPRTSLGYEDKSSDDDKKEKILFYFVIVLGYITGFWGIIATLYFKRSWRHACFRRVDDFADTMYVAIAIRIARLKKMIKKYQ